jgi:hypothetical protein
MRHICCKLLLTKQWTQQLGTSTNGGGTGVTVDSLGNIYVTGNVGGGLDGNTNTNLSDLFAVKYNSIRLTY